LDFLAIINRYVRLSKSLHHAPFHRETKHGEVYLAVLVYTGKINIGKKN